MKNAIVALACLALAAAAAPAQAKKKPKKGLGPVITATATGNLTTAVGEVSTAAAICPSGKQAVGGGYALPLVTSTVRLFAVSSLRSGTQTWSVSAVNRLGSGSITAFAYCRNASRVVTDVASTGTVSGEAGRLASALSACPSGTHLIGGGFSVTTGPSADEFALPTSSLNTFPGAWATTVLNNGGGAQTVTNHAYCMSGIPPPVIVTATSFPTVARGAFVAANSPACPPTKDQKGKKKKRRKQPANLLAAGGFGSQPARPIVTFTESRIASTTWLNAGTSVNGPDDTSTVTAQGICF